MDIHFKTRGIGGGSREARYYAPAAAPYSTDAGQCGVVLRQAVGFLAVMLQGCGFDTSFEPDSEDLMSSFEPTADTFTGGSGSAFS